MTDLDKRMKIINDFCLTAVTITAMVAVSCMATVALTKPVEIEETFTISTNHNDSIAINDVCCYKSPIKYTMSNCNPCFRVDANGYITFKKSGYYTLYSQIRKNDCDQVRVVIYDANFEAVKSRSDACCGIENDKSRNYMSDVAYFNAGDKISVLIVKDMSVAQATCIECVVCDTEKKGESATAPTRDQGQFALLFGPLNANPLLPTDSKAPLTDSKAPLKNKQYARLTITRIPQKLMHFHKQ